VDLPASLAATGTVAVADADIDDRLDNSLKYFERSMKDQQERFDTAVDTLCQSTDMIQHGSMISFMGIIPPAKGDKTNENGDN
jgi:hypothetical protein